MHSEATRPHGSRRFAKEKMLLGTALILAIAIFPDCRFVEDCIARRLSSADPVKGLSRFLDYAANASQDKFIPNPDFWLKDVDFTCVSPWNSGGGRLRAGTAISKRHVVFAKHFPLWKDIRVVFADKSGEVCPVRVVSTKAVENTDIMIGALDYELTPNIHPAKILPPDFEKYLGDCRDLPVLTFNQHEKVFLNELNANPTNGAPWRRFVGHKPTDPKREGFREDFVVGDSGNPSFALIGDEPILLYCLQFGGAGAGHALHLHRREIQKAMDDLCPGYKLECFDFSKVSHAN